MKSPDEQMKELYAAKDFVVRSRYDGGVSFAMKVHCAKSGKTIQEFMVWLKTDQPHLKCKPFWADGGKPAVEIVAVDGRKLHWEMPTRIENTKVISIYVERMKLDAKIYEAVSESTGDPAAESDVNLKLNRDAHYVAMRFTLSMSESLDEFLFLESYRMAGRKI